MGHRGRVVIEKQGERKFFNIGGANTVHWWLVLGPEGVDKLIYGMPEGKWIESPTVRSECGIYVNYDTRELLWFGAEDERFFFSPRQDLLSLMTPAWDGWSTSWAHSALFDVARRCELGLGEDSANSRPKLTFDKWSEVLDEVVVGACEPGNLRYGSDFLLSVHDSARTKAMLGHHPRLFDGSILDAPPEALLELPGLSEEELVVTAPPNQGIHIDLNDQAIHYWAAYYPGDLGNLHDSDWSYRRISSDFDGQIALASPTVVSTHEGQNVERLTR